MIGWIKQASALAIVESPYRQQNESDIAGMIGLIGLIIVLNLCIRLIARTQKSAL